MSLYTVLRVASLVLVAAFVAKAVAEEEVVVVWRLK